MHTCTLTHSHQQARPHEVVMASLYPKSLFWAPVWPLFIQKAPPQAPQPSQVPCVSQGCTFQTSCSSVTTHVCTHVIHMNCMLSTCTVAYKVESRYINRTLSLPSSLKNMPQEYGTDLTVFPPGAQVPGGASIPADGADASPTAVVLAAFQPCSTGPACAPAEAVTLSLNQGCGWIAPCFFNQHFLNLSTVGRASLTSASPSVRFSFCWVAGL